MDDAELVCVGTVLISRRKLTYSDDTATNGEPMCCFKVGRFYSPPPPNIYVNNTNSFCWIASFYLLPEIRFTIVYFLHPVAPITNTLLLSVMHNVSLLHYKLAACFDVSNASSGQT